MDILTAKKVIVIGAADGVPSQAICNALQEMKVEVILSINQYFV